MNFKNILCPIDFSENMDKIINLAINQCQVNGSILFFNQITTIGFEKDEENFEKDTDLIKNRQVEMEVLIKKLISSHPAIHFHYELCYDMDIAKEINTIAKQHNIDLIVMGSHGRSGLHKIFMGSVAIDVLEEVSCPLLIVKI
jgi:nucleotide-binding universal stress UspA family protein